MTHKIFSLIITMLTAGFASSQIITFNFNADPYLQVSNNNANITVSDIALSAGTISTNVATGSYFLDEPYIEEGGGWDELTQTDAKYFYITVAANSGYTFDITNISYEAYATSAGPSAIGSAIDNANLFEQDMPAASLVSVNETVSGQLGLTTATIKIQGWTNASRGTTGGGTLRIDNLIIQGGVNKIPTNDTNSELTIGADAEPSAILSTQNDDTNPLQVLDFTFSDAGTSDGLATIINQLTITQGANNTISDWQNAIAGAKLFGPDIASEGLAGTLSANNIVFQSTPLAFIADKGNETYQLKIYLLNDLSLINDNDIFDFELLYGNIVNDGTGSSFGSGTVSSSAVSLTIEASELRFQPLATSTYTNQDFSATVKAIDNNGNLDTDFNTQVTLSLNAGNGNISSVSGLSKSASTGIASWNNLRYDTEEVFSLTATTSGLANNTTNSQSISATTPTSELHDDFEDGDLDGWGNTADWTNSAIEPTNGARSLKHNLSETTGFSYIYHDLAALDLGTKSVVWRFNLKNGDWDPSGANKFWFYLLANENNLNSSTIDGYAVGVNFDGTDDLLKLWKVTDGTTEVALITSRFNWSESDLIGIEIIRSASGRWVLNYYENSSFENAQVAGYATNPDYTFTDYCGLVFSYGTASRAGLLWLDNVSIALDNKPPVVSSVTAIDEITLQIQFSEIIDRISAEDISNYSIENLSSPSTAALNGDETLLTLTFPSAFETNQTYSLTISNIEDVSGNIITSSSYNFKYIPFKTKNLFVINQTEIMLEFTHPLEPGSAEKEANYFVDNGVGQALSATLLNDSIVSLIFSNFSPNVEYLLNITNIKSTKGLELDSENINFSYYPGEPFDLIINELMTDISPSPTVLPPVKYIELYNRSANPMDISGWKLQIGDNPLRNFENYILPANEYLTLCSATDEEKMRTFGNVMGILSESQLKTTGTSLILYNKEGQLIEYLNYSKNWYKNGTKSEGGWSLERIDPENFCSAESNWKASDDYKGGTPGQENSVKANNPDTVPITLLHVNVLSSNKLLLCFSKNLTEATALKTANYQLSSGSKPLFSQFSSTSRSDIILQFEGNFTDAQEQEIRISGLHDFCGNIIKDTSATFTYYQISATEAFASSDKFVRVLFSEEVEINTAQTTANYQASDGIGSPIAAYKHSERKNEVFLEFPIEFTTGNSYTLNIENVTDLNGNSIKPSELSFTYFVPSRNDVIINELLFNPKPESFDFVELYNKATMPVDLSKLSLARRNDAGELESVKQLSEFNKMLEPGVFLAVSTDTARTKLDYPATSFDRFLQIPVLPAYNDNEGTVVLLFGDSIIDEFSYNEDMHFALMSDKEGVSLERIDPLKTTNDADNWHSAAKTAGFATPANQNSQFRKLSEEIDEDIKVEPETFSPNNDGYEDVVFIRYQFNEPGYVANVSIYDGKGRLVKRIANNELLATEGEFSWDGLYTNQSKARIGIYVIYFEVFNLQGVVKKTKKICVLADRLN